MYRWWWLPRNVFVIRIIRFGFGESCEQVGGRDIGFRNATPWWVLNRTVYLHYTSANWVENTETPLSAKFTIFTHHDKRYTCADRYLIAKILTDCTATLFHVYPQVDINFYTHQCTCVKKRGKFWWNRFLFFSSFFSCSALLVFSTLLERIF